MELQLDNSFIRDVKKSPLLVQKEVAVIINSIRTAKNFQEIKNLKKLKGSKNVYRIKVDQYRVGFYVENGIIILSRCLSRKDIYKYFP